jgi:hypothetical protein
VTLIIAWNGLSTFGKAVKTTISKVFATVKTSAVKSVVA